MVSEAKCNIYFSPNVNVEVKAEICTNLNIMTEAISDKYLGLPAMVGLDKSENFLYLLERIIERLKGWKEKFLSMGGKEILLKAIIQSIPVFAMGVFKIPKGLCKEINDAMSGFWWGDTEDQKSMH
jgi:flagellar biosynthesis protein FliR